VRKIVAAGITAVLAMAAIAIATDSPRVANLTGHLADVLRGHADLRKVGIARNRKGDFLVHTRLNGRAVPMIIDTGATAVVLTHDAAKAAGLPLEVLQFSVDLETASGRTRAAAVTVDRLAVGGLVERSVPALVVPPGQLSTSLLGMTFLDRLESWEVRAGRLMLRGYP
jgi:clan AA aspartic protease (TIGR02281 family)